MKTKNSYTLELVSGAETAINKLHERIAELEYENSKLKAEKGEEEGDCHVPAFDCLAVSQVTVWPINDGQKLGHIRGLAQVVLNDQLVIRGLRIMESEYGLYVGYPNDPFYKGEDFKAIVNPITRQLKDHIEACVLEKYEASIA